VLVVAARKRWTECRCLRRRSLRDCSAVLAPAAGLQTRCAQTGRPLESPLALRSSGDDSKAAHLRQPLLLRHCLARGVSSFTAPHSERRRRLRAANQQRSTLARRDRLFDQSVLDRVMRQLCITSHRHFFENARAVNTDCLGAQCEFGRNIRQSLARCDQLQRLKFAV